MSLAGRIYRRLHRPRNVEEAPKPESDYQRWISDGGDYAHRFAYPLTTSSLVFDVGGYQGQWASDLFSRYRCTIVVFEPLKQFASRIKERFGLNEQITVNEFGLGARTRLEMMSLEDDESSILRDSGSTERVQIVDVAEILKGFARVDLMKINIEGAEYELLERLIESGSIKKIRNIQVQFHNTIPDAKSRMQSIQAQLSKTHRLTYQYEFVWENWTIVE